MSNRARAYREDLELSQPRRIPMADQLAGTMLEAAPSKAGALATSRKAGRQIAPRAPSIKLRMLQAIAGSPSGLAPDQAADLIGADHLAVRPRASQAHRDDGWLEPTGAEWESSHGGPQAVLRITAAGRRELERRGMDALSRLMRAGSTSDDGYATT